MMVLPLLVQEVPDWPSLPVVFCFWPGYFAVLILNCPAFSTRYGFGIETAYLCTDMLTSAQWLYTPYSSDSPNSLFSLTQIGENNVAMQAGASLLST